MLLLLLLVLALPLSCQHHTGAQAVCQVPEEATGMMRACELVSCQLQSSANPDWLAQQWLGSALTVHRYSQVQAESRRAALQHVQLSCDFAASTWRMKLANPPTALCKRL
jgi:hypothetical protein